MRKLPFDDWHVKRYLALILRQCSRAVEKRHATEFDQVFAAPTDYQIGQKKPPPDARFSPPKGDACG